MTDQTNKTNGQSDANSAEVGNASGLFLKKFLKHGTRVASVAPSSRTLARAMCRYVTNDKPQVILELGAGTGPVTVVAAELMHPGSTLIAVEIDEDFASVLQKRVPNCKVLCCDVRDLDAKLDELGIEQVDVMINCLPTPSLPKALNRAVLDVFASRGTQACYTQLTVMPYVYWSMYRRVFDEVEYQLVVRNIPPGGAYHCRGLKANYLEQLPGK